MAIEETKISAGSYDLNKFLSGGYEKEIITTICGNAGTGKTNLCLLASVSQAKKGNKVIYIDTEGGFSIERVKQIAGNEYEEILKNIILLKPTSFEEQKKAFSSLLKEIREKGKIGLIIIDGMTMLYRLELAEKAQKEKESREKSQEKNKDNIKEANSELARQMRILAEISRKQNIPVIITNQVYTEFITREQKENGWKAETRMVGGDILKYWSKCIILLENEQGRRKLIIKKHRSLPQKELSFTITNEGIKKRGWI